MRLRDLLNESTVKVGLESADKDECFEELLDLLVRAGCVTDRGAALAAIRKREAEGTTGIGSGFAVPHGKDPSIQGLCVALGTSARGIEFDAVDDQPVHAVVLILASTHEPGKHIQLLAEVVRLLRLPNFKASILRADSAQTLLDALDDAE